MGEYAAHILGNILARVRGIDEGIGMFECVARIFGRNTPCQPRRRVAVAQNRCPVVGRHVKVCSRTVVGNVRQPNNIVTLAHMV